MPLKFKSAEFHAEQMSDRIKLYSYQGCSACRKAKQYLDKHQIPYDEFPIRQQPPSKQELKSTLAAYDGDYRRLFNTSGQSYRQGGFKNRLAAMSGDEKIAALAADGNLIKRPFLIGEKLKLVGFKEEEWKRLHE